MGKKERYYERERIEVCRNCQGFGLVLLDGEFLPSTTCPVCEGSGRVKKTSKVAITIEPYVAPSGG